jgi:hypothetical protein
MHICCNYDCLGHTGKNKRRCGKCRMRNIQTCADCGVSLGNNNKVVCLNCKAYKRTSYIIDWKKRNPEKVMLYVKKHNNKQLNKERYRILP